ncbi:MAG: THUMP domain-containing protein [Nanoarchaeota archaeon]|nr:THUMP domain-containing protein [Nanoarchaeota archaeon]
MKAFALTHKGCEEFAAAEIEEKLKTKCEYETGKAIVFFNVKTEIDICKICYTGQSIIKTGLFLEKGKIENPKLTADFSKYLKEDESFKVLCLKQDSEITRADFEGKIGKLIINQIEAKTKRVQKVSLKNPNIIFLCFICDDEFYLGLDFAGIDLSKREYKIFSNPCSIKGSLGFSLIKFSGYDKKENIVDVMSGDGVIMIEAGLYAAGFPVNFFQKEKLAFNKFSFLENDKIKKMFEDTDKKIKKDNMNILGLDSSLRNVKAARKNAKISGISRLIEFSKIDIDWLDIKIKEKSIGKIISQLPCPSKNVDENELKTIYNELFYQVEYIIKNKGELAIIIKKKELILELMKKYGFELKREKEVWAGQQQLYFLLLTKNTK